jgi:hypothetical protein
MKIIFLLTRIFAVLMMLLTAIRYADGQTISPVIQECGRKCSGTFKLTNNGLDPMAVVVTSQSFTIVNGKQVFGDAASVTLSETSARIGPKQSHDFDVKIRCLQTPCAVQLAVAMMLGHTTEGLAVRGILPEVFYICDRSKDCRKKTLMAGGVPVQ